MSINAILADLAVAYDDWLSLRAYYDGNGNYRLRPPGSKSGKTKHLAPWNALVKKHYGKDNERFCRDARAWQENHTLLKKLSMEPRNIPFAEAKELLNKCHRVLLVLLDPTKEEEDEDVQPLTDAQVSDAEELVEAAVDLLRTFHMQMNLPENRVRASEIDEVDGGAAKVLADANIVAKEKR